jgi:hypothetical protein
MGRIELLFGELASEPGMVKVSRHALPDPRRPLRMQCSGIPTPRRMRTRWRAALWGRALLASPGGRKRATILGLLAMIGGVLLQNSFWRLAMIGVLTASSALIAGAWTEVAIMAEQLERARN